jgi:hypothetical protein
MSLILVNLQVNIFVYVSKNRRIFADNTVAAFSGCASRPADERPTISETIPRKGRIDTKIVGRSSAGRDAQPLKSNHGIISENMAIFRNIDKYIYLQIY